MSSVDTDDVVVHHLGQRARQIVDERFPTLPPKSRQCLATTLQWAAEAHGSQRRKNSFQEPYIVHPLGVAQLLYKSGTEDLVTLQAALLHDTIEDTWVVEDDIHDTFGAKVLDVVLQCTDDKSLLKAKRKSLQIETAADKSKRARAVKLADKLYNLRDIIRDPPLEWTAERIQEYFIWAKKVTDACLSRGRLTGCERIVSELERLYRDGTFQLHPADRSAGRNKCHPAIGYSGAERIEVMSREDLTSLDCFDENEKDSEGYLKYDQVTERSSSPLLRDGSHDDPALALLAHENEDAGDDDDSDTSSNMSTSTLDSELHHILAQEQWDESVAQFKLILSVVLGPLVGKWLGRRFAVWGWEILIRRGWGGFVIS